MLALVQVWVAICLFRVRPQDLPVSWSTLLAGVISYLLVNILLSSVSEPLGRAIGASVLDMMVLYLFVRVALLIRQKPERLIQTLSAMTGTGAILGFVALPVIAVGTPELVGDQVNSVFALLWLGLVIWSVGVFGYIMSHALSVTLPIGLVISMAYIVLSFQVMQGLLPASV